MDAVAPRLSFAERWASRGLRGDHAADLAMAAFMFVVLFVPFVWPVVDYDSVAARTMLLAMPCLLLALVHFERLGARRLVERRDQEIRDLKRQLNRIGSRDVA